MPRTVFAASRTAASAAFAKLSGDEPMIVITHQKRTMEAADSLYGVTMGADGVSQIVSRRVPREAPIAATA